MGLLSGGLTSIDSTIERLFLFPTAPPRVANAATSVINKPLNKPLNQQIQKQASQVGRSALGHVLDPALGDLKYGAVWVGLMVLGIALIWEGLARSGAPGPRPSALVAGALA